MSDLEEHYAARIDELEVLLDIARDAATVAVARGAELEAEVERLRVVARLATDAGDTARAAVRDACKLFARIATEDRYNQVTTETWKSVCEWQSSPVVMAAMEAAQPPAPARTVKRHPPRTIPEDQLAPIEAPARTEAEQAVLDAMAALNEATLVMQTGGWAIVAKAELARRGLK